MSRGSAKLVFPTCAKPDFAWIVPGTELYNFEGFLPSVLSVTIFYCEEFVLGEMGTAMFACWVAMPEEHTGFLYYCCDI